MDRALEVGLKINGKSLSAEEAIKYTQKIIRALKKEKQTEAVHNKLKFEYARLERYKDIKKYNDLGDAMMKVRSSKLFDKMMKEQDRLRKKLRDHKYYEA